MSETGLERHDVGPRAAALVLRSPNFGPDFFGNAASASGTWFQNLAASLLVYRLTHSAFLLASSTSPSSFRSSSSRCGARSCGSDRLDDSR